MVTVVTNKYGQTVALPPKDNTDNANEKAKEISMVKMLDKYGWDFDYVRPSETTKAEEVFLNERG